MNSTYHHRSNAALILLIKTRLLPFGISLLLLLSSFRNGEARMIPASPGAAYDPVVDLALGMQDVLVLGDEANAYLSESSGSADFNGDGINDLLVGAAGHSRNGSLAGAAYMVLGGNNLAATIDLAASPASFTIFGTSTNEALGHSVAGGDVNGDGYADLIIGADGANSNTGAVYVVLGGASRFANPVIVDLAQSKQGVALTIKGRYANGGFGRSVSSGDINKDGFDDIIVGSHTASPGGRTNAGAVFVILGNSSISTSAPKTIDLQQTPQAAALTIRGESSSSNMPAESLNPGGNASPLFADELQPQAPAEVSDRLGRSVAAGDVNGDGIADIIAGSQGANVGDNADAGRTYVFYGSTSYSDAAPQTIDLSTTSASLTLNGVDAGDQSGFFVAAGDLNQDGYADILTSAYISQGHNNAAPSAGEVYVVYGGAGLPASLNLASQASVTIYGSAAGDRLGRSVAAGDVNGDGYADLILGASRADPDGTRLDVGTVSVVYGGANLPSTVLLSDPNNANIRILGAGPAATTCDSTVLPGIDCSDELGHSTASGDINGDGVDDIIAGAIFANNAAIQDAGAAYILYGSPATGAQISPDRAIVDPGQQIAYTLMAMNKFGPWDVTKHASFSIAGGAGGSWKGNVYTAGQSAGNWTVTGIFQNVSATARLSINPGPPVSLHIRPDTPGAWVGDTKILYAWAADAVGNTWDVSRETSFNISPGAGGSWRGNLYTTGTAGAWTVTGVYQDLSAMAALNVAEHNPAVAIKIHPLNTRIWVFEKLAYTAIAVDAQGVTWDVSAKTYFFSPGGNWEGNSFTGGRLGTFEVKGDYLGLTDFASVIIAEHGPAVAIKIQPAHQLVQVGEPVTYTAWATDARGNTWNATAETSFSTQAGASGSWDGNSFTPPATGDWTFVGSYQGLTDQATLTVLEEVNKINLPVVLK